MKVGFQESVRLTIAPVTEIPSTWADRRCQERSGTNVAQRDAAEPPQTVADPVVAEFENVLALRRTGAAPKVLRRALRRIEELLDE